jgi:hypothetical protein
MKISLDCCKAFLPYCIRHLGEGLYVILNRYYMPLGYSRNPGLSKVEEQALFQKYAIKLSSPHVLQSLHYGNPREDGHIFLHSGNGFPDINSEKAYVEKLDTLVKFGIGF